MANRKGRKGQEEGAQQAVEVWSVMIEVWSKLSVVNRKGRNRKGTRPSHHMLMSEGLRMGGCGLKECGVRQK